MYAVELGQLTGSDDTVLDDVSVRLTPRALVATLGEPLKEQVKRSVDELRKAN